jgi:hypothetical protein
MNSTLTTGRRRAAALATAVLTAALTVPTVAFGAPPEQAGPPEHAGASDQAGSSEQAGGKPECINTDPAHGEGKNDGNQGNDGSHGAVGCDGGDNPGGDTPGGDTPGGDTPGGDNPEVGSGTGTEDEEEDPAAEPQPTDATLPGDWCDATTLAFLPGEAGTHEHAVALTAQAFEQGVPGWERVTWAATDRASVRAVAARHGDVVTLLTDGELSTGTLDEVEELLVCAEITDPPTDGTTTGAGDDEAEVLGLVLQRTDGAKAATSDGTEVLGVTLARTGFDAGWLAAVGALTLLAGGGVLTATRRRGSEAVA